MRSIGILGMGSVGNAVREGLSPHFEVRFWDIDGRGDLTATLEADAVFVCVPTEPLERRSSRSPLDMSNVKQAVETLQRSNYTGLVIVKSTIQPGTMNELVQTWPEGRLTYMPEFLRERSAVEWFANPDRLIVSGQSTDCDAAFEVFQWVPEWVPRIAMQHLEAEIGKLAHNAYIATKVAFTCEVERICVLHDVDPNPVMESVWRDRRVMNPAHLTPGLGGFDGKCVPKDTGALRSIDSDNRSLLKTVQEVGKKSNATARLKEARDRRTSEQTNNMAENNIVKKNEKSGFLGGVLGILGPLIFVCFILFIVFGFLSIGHETGYAAGFEDGSSKFNVHLLSPASVDATSIGDFSYKDFVVLDTFTWSSISSFTTSDTTCGSSISGDGGTDCTTSYDEHTTLVSEHANLSIHADVVTNTFIEDCFNHNCSVTGRVLSTSSGKLILFDVNYVVKDGDVS